MGRIKLLFITKDFRPRMERSTYYLTRELAKLTKLEVWHEPGHIQDILRKISFVPDFILLNDMKKSHCPEITGLSSLSIPYGIIMHDIHYKIDDRKKYIKNNRVKHIFSIYRDNFEKWYPEFTDRMRWLPHFANTKIFRDYGLKKEIDWLLMGKVSSHYPLRKKILEKMKERSGFVYHEHPGYGSLSDEKKESALYGKRYAREINRAKMFLTCGLKYKYPVRKYYEVLACKTLLLAPKSKELKDLGFIPGTHYVSINEKNFLKKAEYYLEHKEERVKIAKQGYEFIHRRHSLEVRAAEMVRMIKGIIKSCNKKQMKPI